MLRRLALSGGLRGALLRAAATTALDAKGIVEAIQSRKVFDEAMVRSGVQDFCNLRFDATYLSAFSPSDIADHAYGYLTAVARSKYGSHFFYSKEKATSAFYFTTADRKDQLRTMRRIDQFIQERKLTATHGATVRSYSAGNGECVFFDVELTPFVNPKPKEDELDTTTLGTELYGKVRSERIKPRNQELMNRVFTSTTPVYTSTTLEDGTVALSLAVIADRPSYLAALSALVYEAPGAKIVKKFQDTFANGVQMYTMYVTGCSAKVLEERATLISLMPNQPDNAITHMHQATILNAEQSLYANTLVAFAFYFTPPPTDEDYVAVRTQLAKDPVAVKRLNNLRASLSTEIMSERYTSELIASYPELLKRLYADFMAGSTAETREALRQEITKRLKEDGRTAHDVRIMETFLTFNQAALKHNFCRVGKAAMAYRLDCSFISKLDFPRVPHGIFFFVGGHFRGFHVRFTEIARGGVRMIISTPSSYKKNKMTVFQENYNLAHTQLLKNKDIPEGGSKGTILVSAQYLNKFEETKCKQLFLQYVDALLDVIIPGTEGVVDRYKKEEIIFTGPDENTAGTFPSAGAEYSKTRGYSAWKSFTTGKDPRLGGIPHDTYGMTTRSVRRCVEGIYRKLNIDGSKLTKFQTGGPDGDLGANEITRGNEITTAMVDISASAYDPNGLNQEELVRLATNHLKLDQFNPLKLSPKGFLVKIADKNVKLPDGTMVADGYSFRDNFHMTDYTKADTFVPCGGRPASVTLENVHKLLYVEGATGEAMLAGKYEKVGKEALKYKYIVEGANLFLTQDARLAIERCGTIVIKDATANKGGVTSSSLEVLTGLAMSDAEHRQHMSAKSEHDAPAFYKANVAEICARVEGNADREFEALWREAEANPSMPKTLISDALSEKIVVIRSNILQSNVFANKKFLRYVMESYAPKTLQTVVPVDTMMQRVPANYQHAICAMWLASDYVYKTGTKGNEFDFFEFMQAHYSKAGCSQ